MKTQKKDLQFVARQKGNEESAENQKILFQSLMMKEKNLWRSEEVMKLLQVSKSTLYRWRKDMILPCAQLGSIYYYSEAVLTSFMARRMQKSIRPND